MAGRYPESAITKHPAFEQGQAASAENEQLHQQRAKELKPRGLTRAEKKVWDRIAPELSRLGRLRPHYVDFVEQYCVVKVRMDDLRSFLDEEDWSYATSGRHGIQHKSRPQVAQLNDDWRKWNSLVAQLGISPATALRFNDKQGSLFEDDEFGKL
jgi:P27 family predicted phage terminase small subunit